MYKRIIIKTCHTLNKQIRWNNSIVIIADAMSTEEYKLNRMESYRYNVCSYMRWWWCTYSFARYDMIDNDIAFLFPFFLYCCILLCLHANTFFMCLYLCGVCVCVLCIVFVYFTLPFGNASIAVNQFSPYSVCVVHFCIVHTEANCLSFFIYIYYIYLYSHIHSFEDYGRAKNNPHVSHTEYFTQATDTNSYLIFWILSIHF